MKKVPRITITFVIKNGQKARMSTSLSKIKNFGNHSLVKKAKSGYFKSFCVKFFYGRDRKGTITNEMDCKDYSDLVWAFKAFSDKTLWL